MHIVMVARATLVTAGVVALLALAPTVHAQDAAPERTALARSLFQEGVELARTEHYEDAADRFRRAYELRPAPPIAFNLASALGHLGRMVEATELLRGVVHAPDVTPELRTAAELQLEQLTARLGRLTVRATGALEGARIELDQRELASAAIGVPMPIDPGAHVAVALRGAQEVAREQVDVSEGQSAELTLVVPERAREVPAEALIVEPEGRRDAPAGDDSGVWIGVGIGIGVLVIAGAVVAAIVLTQPGAPDAISGNTSPAVLEW